MTAGMATILVVVAISGVMWLVAKLGEMAAETQRRQEEDARLGRKGRTSSPEDIERILRAAGVLGGGPAAPEVRRPAPPPARPQPARPQPAPNRLATRPLTGPEPTHGGQLDAHHIGSLGGSHVGETLSRRHLDSHGVAIEGRHVESHVGSRSISAQEATARVLATPLARLERLPVLTRAVVLAEILGPPPSARRAPARRAPPKKPNPAAPAA